uniref:keratin, type I cytoskeletal 13-like n=1 Tax=Pristiophorus japonicus TaxID=55135 RepID=UPI00398F83AD
MSIFRKSVKISSSGSGSSIGGGNFGKTAMRPQMFSSSSLQSMGSRSRMSTGYGGYQSVGLSMGGGYRASSGGASLMSMGGLMGNNEKDTMQNLNQRLSIYLEKVRSLEVSNSDLERQIREFASSKSIESFDWSIYNTMVKPLQQQIINSLLQNSRISLETDNARLAAEDFKHKWESELMLRQSVENDINGLHQLKETYLQLHSNLASDITGLEDEIAYLKKNHAEELKMLRQQKTQDINVNVDSEPCVDLAATLQQLRDEYTKIVDNNQKDLDNWYKEQLSIKVTQTTQSNQAVDGAKAELTTLRRQLQSFEADYNSLSGNLTALQNTLYETDGRYAMQLQQIMSTVSQLEGELGGIRNNLMGQSQSYKDLLNIKMKLEGEIQQYRLLLDGNSQSLIHSGSSSSSMISGSQSQSRSQSQSQSQSGMSTTSTTTTTKIITDRSRF